MLDFNKIKLIWIISLQVPPTLSSKHGTPINKGNIYISETSPQVVAKAYASQFEEDFTGFLRHRSEEMANNARMFLTHPGRPCSTWSSTWTPFEFKIITKALISLLSEVSNLPLLQMFMLWDFYELLIFILYFNC